MTRARPVLIAMIAIGLSAHSARAQVAADSLCHYANAVGSSKKFALSNGYTVELRRSVDSLVEFGCSAIVRNARNAIVWRGEGFGTALFPGSGLDIDNDGHPDALIGEDTGGGNRCCWSVTVLRLEPKFEVIGKLDFVPFFDRDEHGHTLIDQVVAFYDLGPSMAESPVVNLVHQFRNGKLVDITLERCPVILGDTARRVGTLEWDRDGLTPTALAAARNGSDSTYDVMHTRASVRAIAMQHLLCQQPEVAEKWVRDAWPASQVESELAVLRHAVAARMPTTPPRGMVRGTRPSTPLFRRSDAMFLSSALGAAALTSFADLRFATEIREGGPQRQAWHSVTQLGTSVGDVGPLVFTLALWSGGGIARRRDWETLGREGAEAFLIAGSATALLKGVVGRERPSASANDADVYVIGHGFGNNAFSSFPSGHTSVAFAVATAMAVGTQDKSPLVHRTVTALAYGVATSVGLSRLYNNKHWTSDVVGGAAVGVTSGLMAVRFNHRGGESPSAGYFADIFDHVSVAPAAGRGIVVGYSLR